MPGFSQAPRVPGVPPGSPQWSPNPAGVPATLAAGSTPPKSAPGNKTMVRGTAPEPQTTAATRDWPKAPAMPTPPLNPPITSQTPTATPFQRLTLPTPESMGIRTVSAPVADVTHDPQAMQKKLESLGAERLQLDRLNDGAVRVSFLMKTGQDSRPYDLVHARGMTVEVALQDALRQVESRR